MRSAALTTWMLFSITSPALAADGHRAAAAHSASVTNPQAAAWREDLKTLVRELPRRHPAPFLHVSEAAWDSASAELDRRLPGMTRDQALVGFMQLVALLSDAHTVVAPDSAAGIRFYPLELYSFEDGLFVRRADAAHADLVGARVLRWGRASADSALARVASIVSHENEWWVRAMGPFDLTMPELLDGLGLVTNMERLPLVVERAGHVDTVIVAPAGAVASQHGHGLAPVDMDAWATMREAPAPWWEERPDEPMWWKHDPSTSTLYVCMREVSPAPHSFTNRSQWNEIFALADSVGPVRMVIDLRENTGGNGGLNRYPVQQIIRRPWLDRPDHLFVVIGRLTFSAAQQFTNLLEAWTQATLVGEPTGQRTSQYGDHRPLHLDGIQATVQISSVFHQAPNEFDARAFVPPRIYTPLDSRSYRLGIDPALHAILQPDTTAPVLESIQRALVAGDSAGAERALHTARDQVANHFRTFEADVNRLGYQLLGEGKGELAVQVFRLNTRAYPESANAWDSLGEALLGAGRREDAIAAYRQAVRNNSAFTPSIEALRRLGVSP